MPSLGDVFEAYMLSNPNRKASINRNYRDEINYLKDWHNKPIDAITRADVQERLNAVSKEHGPYPDGRLAVFHGPRKLAQYHPDGRQIREKQNQAASCHSFGAFLCH